MSYHDHLNRHRVTRSMRRKCRLEAHEADPPRKKKIYVEKEQPSPANMVSTSTSNVHALEDRGLPDNTMQPKAALQEQAISLGARSAGDSSPTVVTVFQVLDADAHTIGQYTGVTLPLTLSNPAYGSLTIPAPTQSADSASASETSASPAYTSLTAETPSLTQTSQTETTTSSASSSSSTSTASTSSSSSSSTQTSPTLTSSTDTSSSTSSGSTTTSSSATGLHGSSNASDNSHNATPKIVGGVVGGVVGLILLLLIALFFLYRWKKSSRKAQGAPVPASGSGSGSAPSDGAAAAAAAAPPREQQSPPPPRSAGTSSERSRTSPDALFTAAYLAPAFMRRWRNSTMTTQTDNTEVSERGFQKVSGRKIPSVLQSGGDGYGGGLLGRTSPSGGEPSSRASPPTQAAPPTTRPYGAPLDVTRTRESDESDGVVVVRPSPARTAHPGAVDVSSADLAAPSSAVSQRTDVVGRSRPSLDESRGSRFTESI